MFWRISCCLFFLHTQPDVIGGVSWYFVAEVVDYLLLKVSGLGQISRLEICSDKDLRCFQ